MLSKVRQKKFGTARKLQNEQIIFPIIIKKSHFDEKKTTFPGKKHHSGKKAQKTLLFFRNTRWEDWKFYCITVSQ